MFENWPQIKTTFKRCFCSQLTSNWEVSVSHFLDSLINFAQNTHKLVIISYIESIATMVPIEIHILCAFTQYLKQIVGKSLCRCFIYVFVSIDCILCHFQRFMVLNATLWLTVTHTFKGNQPKLANWSN